MGVTAAQGRGESDSRQWDRQQQRPSGGRPLQPGAREWQGQAQAAPRQPRLNAAAQDFVPPGKHPQYLSQLTLHWQPSSWPFICAIWLQMSMECVLCKSICKQSKCLQIHPRAERVIGIVSPKTRWRRRKGKEVQGISSMDDLVLCRIQCGRPLRLPGLRVWRVGVPAAGSLWPAPTIPS